MWKPQVGKTTGSDNRKNSLCVWRVQIGLKAMCLCERSICNYKFTQNTLSKLRKIVNNFWYGRKKVMMILDWLRINLG